MEHESEKRDRFQPHRRHSLAFVASVAAHVLVIGALLLLIPEAERPHHDWVLAYLVEFDRPGTPGMGAGAGDARPGSLPVATRADAPAAAMPRAPHPHLHRAARAEAKPPSRAPRPKTADLTAAPASGAAAISAGRESAPPADAGSADSGGQVVSAAPIRRGLAGGGGGGLAAAGDGSGSSSAHADYGQNPVPRYPTEARRHAQQGTVVLRVEVGVDGSVARIEVAQSSGFDALDDSAIDTVRSRWRFVPARRDGIAVASWCEVPIRFALTEAEAD